MRYRTLAAVFAITASQQTAQTDREFKRESWLPKVAWGAFSNCYALILQMTRIPMWRPTIILQAQNLGLARHPVWNLAPVAPESPTNRCMFDVCPYAYCSILHPSNQPTNPGPWSPISLSSCDWRFDSLDPFIYLFPINNRQDFQT